MRQGMLSTEHFWELNVIAIIVVILIVAVIAYIILKGRRENKKSPIITEMATVEKMEKMVSSSGQASLRAKNGMSLGLTVESTIVTFKFESGDTIELKMDDDQCNKIRNVKKGKLSYQGSRFISFQ